MITFEEARSRILASAARLPVRDLGSGDCLGLVLAEPVVAEHPIPPFDNSAMDGYAVRHEDVADGPVELPVVTVSSAGTPSGRAIGRGECARILTGAAMVGGADTVVPVEGTSLAREGAGDSPAWVAFEEVPARGAHVRRAGEDLRKGEIAVEAGTVLGPSEIGLAASCGSSLLTVVPRPRVAVVSTGGELVRPGAGPLEPGQIYDSNGVTIASALAARSGIRGATTEHVGDDPGECLSVLRGLARDHDVVLTTGGVSMGAEYDVVKAALSRGEPDATAEFWQIAIKPAKPLAFGRVGEAHLVGLPGNPVSALVAFELFVRPLLARLAGREVELPAFERGELGMRIRKQRDGKTHFLRVRRGADGRYREAGGQGSHQLHAMAAADALAVLGDEREVYEPGAVVDVIDLRGCGADAS